MSRAPRTVHVVPNASGGWAVKSPSGRASQAFSTQSDAVKAAQTKVRVDGGQLVVQGANGRTKKSFTLGRAAMEKLNAVEGVALTPATKRAFKEFDRDGLSPSQRRAKLRKSVTKLTATKKTPKKVGSSRTRSTPTAKV